MAPKNNDLQIAKTIKQEIKKKLKNNLISIIFYGSRAKGKAHEESDLDLFILVKKKPKYGSPQNEAIFKITTRYLDQNLLISPTIYDLKYYKKYKNLSYFKEVRKGIKL